MKIDLAPYRVAEPYPDVRNVRPDKGLLATLMEGYSGEASETTTIMQYAYHSLLCKRKYDEIASVMRGIYYVETLHQRLLGDCIYKMGADPKYLLSLQTRQLPWQASVVNYETTPAKMLLADIKGERGAVEYYVKAAESTDQTEVASLMSRLAEDEKLHDKMLTELYHKYFR